MPEKFPTVEQPKQEVLPKKKKNMVRVKQKKEYVQGLRRYEGELPEDVRTTLKKIFQGSEISEGDLHRLQKVYKKIKIERDRAVQETLNKEAKKQEYKVPSPKQLFEKSGHKVPSPESLEKKQKEKEVGMDAFSTEEQISIISDQIENLREQQEQFKKHSEESRQITGEYRPETYKRGEELTREILRLEQDRKEKIGQLKREKIKKQEKLDLPEDFFEVLKTTDKNKIISLKKRMISENHEDIEKIEAIFWLFNALVGGVKIKQEEYQKEVFGFTEREFLLTQFIYANKENKEVLGHRHDDGEYM